MAVISAPAALDSNIFSISEYLEDVKTPFPSHSLLNGIILENTPSSRRKREHVSSRGCGVVERSKEARHEANFLGYVNQTSGSLPDLSYLSEPLLTSTNNLSEAVENTVGNNEQPR
jgi:hypothetical protein